MIAKHTFEEGIYLVSNIAVARNPLFRSEHYFEYFQNKVDKYLTPLCNILGFAYHENQFELLVKMKSEDEFGRFFQKKHKIEILDRIEIPASTYIFSQEMANLQSGFVKHYNWKNDRIGALFCRRFKKELVTSEKEMFEIIKRLNQLNQNVPHVGEWNVNELGPVRNEGLRSSKCYYERAGEEGKEDAFCELKSFIVVKKGDLEAYFMKLPPLCLESNFLTKFLKISKMLNSLEWDS